MKLRCIHGYFQFEAMKSPDFSKFVSLYSLQIARSGDHFTFEELVEAPDYSIEGGLFLGAPCIKTYEGRPWEVMRENRLVYDFILGKVVLIDSIIQAIKVDQTSNYFVTNGMILPGSVTDDGKRVTDYLAFYNSDESRFRYSEIEYE